MTCILFGPDARKRTASLLFDLEQLDRVTAQLETLVQPSDPVTVDIAGFTLKLTVQEIQSVITARSAKIEHELALLGIKLREEGTPDETKPSLPSIDRARQDAALAVTDSVTGTGESA